MNGLLRIMLILLAIMLSAACEPCISEKSEKTFQM